MSLHLDARQRAMLQEMGVTVWAPQEAAAPVVPLAPTTPMTPDAPVTPAASMAPQTAPARPPAPRAAPQAAPRATAPAPQPAPPAAQAPALQLHAAQALYPGADPAQTPPALGAGWLIVAESATPADPLAGDAGKLLDNMLRAMRLHQHPRVFIAALERAATSAPANDLSAGTDIPAALADTIAQLQPTVVLVLGHVAARVALGRAEPLGRLRAQAHQLAGCPAVVTYEPAVLLRQPDSKAAAWADLCRALALARASARSA